MNEICHLKRSFLLFLPKGSFSRVCVYVAIVSTNLILWKVEETTRFEKISINMCMVILDYVS